MATTMDWYQPHLAVRNEDFISGHALAPRKVADLDVGSLLLEKVAAAPEVSKRRIWLEALEEILTKPKKVVYPSRAGRNFKLTDVK